MGSSRTLGELGELVAGHVVGDPQTRVLDVTHDSRQAGEGSLFVAIVGASHDGHDFVDLAAANGATAVCVERRLERTIPQLVVGDTRGAIGQLAAEVHDNPSRALDVIGVTGTNGKTTVTHYVESLLGALGFRTGVIGTIGSRATGELAPSARTTPEASDFQRLLADMRERGVEKVAVEVSSHALELHRVDGTRFAVGAFTNLSQDHLDFHGTMERYREAKHGLFTRFDLGTAVFNVDDRAGSDFAASYPARKVTVGEGGDFQAHAIEPEPGGTRFVLSAGGKDRRVTAPIIGGFNVSNLLVALASVAAVGADLDDAIRLVPELAPVPGRFEVVGAGDHEAMVVVDYAHTPAGIETAVATARGYARGRVLVVFGAGGDRDRAKRPLMGAAAATADLVYLTNDNPRSEDPGVILDEVAAGITGAFARIPDRRSAIGAAVSEAVEGDVLLILGKGHETGQEQDGVVSPFDDRQVAREAMDRLRKSANLRPESGSMET